MPAAIIEKPLLIEQGADFTHKFIWQTGTPPTAVDLTGYTARCQFRETHESADFELDLTTENGGIVLDAQGGISLHAAALLTATVDAPKMVWDLELVSPTGFVRRLLQGKATLSKEVTK